MLEIIAALVLATNVAAQSVVPAGPSTLAGAQAGLSGINFALARVAAQDASEARADGWGATAFVPHVMATRVTPDASYTPGHLCTPSDPNFKEYRYAEHIPYCQRTVTQQMKQEISAHYGIAQTDWPSYEFDHLIPLAIGGDSSIDNLWPQPHGDPDGSNGKDRLEEQLYLQMKAGTLTQAEAVRQIYAWFTSAVLLEKMVKVPGAPQA
jgi:hypothetical protein